MTKCNRIYGPVPSRRLGLSLGVDLIPMKSCPYDCVYCQLGPTRVKTAVRWPYYPKDEILKGVRDWLAVCAPPDFITLAGCGEPTLFEGLGALIREIKAVTTIPVALLTNGALFSDPDVRAEAAEADLVIPSLDAGDEETFQYINQPVDGINLEEVIAGLEAFRGEYRRDIWLEIMILAGYSEVTQRLHDLAKAARRISPDRIQLNTPVRPSARGFAEPVAPWRLEPYCKLFSPTAEVIAEFSRCATSGNSVIEDRSRKLFELLKRRPCSLDDVNASLGLHPNETQKLIQSIESQGRIGRVNKSGRIYYRCLPIAEGE